MILTTPNITSTLATLTSTNTLTTPKVGVTTVQGVAQKAAVSNVPSAAPAFVPSLDSVTVALCNVSLAIKVGIPTYI